LKLVAKADENRCLCDAGMIAQALGQHGAAIRVDFEFFALSEIDDLESFAFLRSCGLPPHNPFNLFDQTRAASFNRIVIEMRVTVNFVGAFLGKDGAERRRYCDSSPLIDLGLDTRCEFIHPSIPRLGRTRIRPPRNLLRIFLPSLPMNTHGGDGGTFDLYPRD
jgi:hypothetical protein